MMRLRAFLLVCTLSMSAFAAGCGGARIEPVDSSLAAGVHDADELYTSLLGDHVEALREAGFGPYLPPPSECPAQSKRKRKKAEQSEKAEEATV